jgi:hypothetical protein
MGFLTRNKIVVAREYICKGNNIVSIAEKVLNAAYRREMMVLMYVDELGDFLSFDPVRVFEQGETNVRDGETFYNIRAEIGTKPDDGRKMTRLEDFGSG